MFGGPHFVGKENLEMTGCSAFRLLWSLLVIGHDMVWRDMEIRQGNQIPLKKHGDLTLWHPFFGVILHSKMDVSTRW